MAVPTKTQAQTLIETVWGNNFFDSLPPKWKSTLKMKRYKTPGVANASLPDEIGTVDLDHLMDEIVATSQVTTNRTNELEKITEKIQVALLLTTITNGQDYDPEFDLVIPFTEHLAINGAEVGNARKEIRPLNSILSEVKTLDLSAFDTVLATYKIEFPAVANVDAPDFLQSLEVVTNTSTGAGDSSELEDSVFWAGSHSLTVPLRSTAQGSVGVTKEIVPVLIPFSGYKRSTRNFIFFLPNPVGVNDVATKLQALTGLTIVPWVAFKARPLTIVVISEHISLQVGTSALWHDSSSDAGNARYTVHGTSASREISVTTKVIRVPPTIHGDLGLAVGTTTSAPVTVSASSQFIYITGFNVTPSRTETAEAKTTVEAFGLDATPGATTLPSTGLLLVGVDPRIYKYGYVMIRAECIDASTL